jgi:hypothetical protein
MISGNCFLLGPLADGDTSVLNHHLHASMICLESYRSAISLVPPSQAYRSCRSIRCRPSIFSSRKERGIADLDQFLHHHCTSPPVAAFTANATEILANEAMGGTAFLLAFAVGGEARHSR